MNAREGTGERQSATAVDSGDMAGNLERVLDVTIEVTVELGRKRMRIADILTLAQGSLVEFPKAADEPLEVRVNGRLVARGGSKRAVCSLRQACR